MYFQTESNISFFIAVSWLNKPFFHQREKKEASNSIKTTEKLSLLPIQEHETVWDNLKESVPS